MNFIRQIDDAGDDLIELTTPIGTTLTGAAVAGVATPEPTSTLVGGAILGGAALVAGSQLLDDNRSRIGRTTIEIPEDPTKERTDIQVPERPTEENTEIQVPEEGTPTEINVPDDVSPSSEIEVPNQFETQPEYDVVRVGQQLIGEQRERGRLGSGEFRRNRGADEDELEEILEGGEGQTLGDEIQETIDDYRYADYEQYRFPGEAEELAEEAQQRQATLEETELPRSAQQTMSGTGTGVDEIPFGGVRSRQRVGQLLGVAQLQADDTGVGTDVLIGLDTGIQSRLSVDQRVAYKLGLTQALQPGQQFPDAYLEEVADEELTEPGEGPPTTSDTPGRPPFPGFVEEDERRGSDSGRREEFAGAGDTGLQGGWGSEFFAAFAGVSRESPSQEELEERPLFERYTGTLPVEGAETEEYEEALDFFTFGDLDSDDESDGGFGLW